MDIRFLGVGSAYNAAQDNTGAFLLRGEDLVLLDCGETNFSLLARYGLLDGLRGHIHVLLTHLHADHAGSLPTLCSYGHYRLQKAVRVIHPSQDAVRLLALMGIPQDQYRYVGGMRAALCGLEVQAVPVRHVPGFASYGYVLDDGRERVYYSGDAGEIPGQVWEEFQQGRISRLYQDVQWVEGEQVPSHHLSFSQLCRLIGPKDRPRVTCMHMNCDYRARAQAMGFAVAAPWTPGECAGH